MVSLLLVALISAALCAHAGLVGVVYYDTGTVALERRRWLLLVGLIPIFGFFMYLFERSELDYDPSTDPYAGGGYNVHPSRADDFPFSSSDGQEGARENSSDGVRRAENEYRTATDDEERTQ
ncbi:PLD nuclease N-terminal domain-containing protein [Halostagnicola kamekurae]|uniref:Phospholipase_D-nuclease N-terminal n=1 Tax=Halostagnicola kamekurae TaxID=619731 RepID=A0A1I6RQ11_9EURY|nr:PLD nuclease N-terminal domain-containing protein [Halostagnicola kamekurae]SFS66774.1 hypothetical protein SAMN04488556_1980 [Halostagnicola kamekurae]